MAERTLELKWEIKVALHCEGCARKVKKSLQRIDGVYRVSVDSAKSKVTVEGDSKLNPDSLIKKLTKIRKPGELLPAPDQKLQSSGEEKWTAAAVLPQNKFDGNEEEIKKKKKKKEAQDAAVLPQNKFDGNEEEIKKKKKEAQDAAGSGSALPEGKDTDVKCSVSEAEFRPDWSNPQLRPETVFTAHTLHYHNYQFVPHQPQFATRMNPYGAVEYSFCPGQSLPRAHPGPTPLSDSLRFNTDMFNDENPNSCTLM